MTKLLDHGYLDYVEHWGSDERIVEAARMSTGKGFLGWEPGVCPTCDGVEYDDYDHGSDKCNDCNGTGRVPGDLGLLRRLWVKKHATPFEMAGMVVEVQAPIMVFREWHRHRTQCLAPGTMIHFDAPKSRGNRRFVYKLPIENLWRKWQPSRRSSRPDRQTNSLFSRSRIQGMQLRCADGTSREVVHTRITDVILGDPKPMVCVWTASGRTLTATIEHRVLTANGWRTLGEAIEAGEMLAMEGTTRGRAERWDVPPVDESVEEWREVWGWEGVYDVSTEGRVRRVGCDPKKTTASANGYEVVSLSRRGYTTVHTVHTLVLEAFVGPKPHGCEARHLNDNRADARLCNLVWGTPSENAADRVASDRQQRLVVVFEEIVEVCDAGVLPSYDLTVEGPWHNFIADGFVVHNSYNEMSARYTPLPDLNYVPSVERLMMNQGTKNKQAAAVEGSATMTEAVAIKYQEELRSAYEADQETYDWALGAGVPKELARLHLPVGRYSRMRASANLRNWLAFLTLRMAEDAQWEIRQYANALCAMLTERFPRTLALFTEGK